MAFFLDRVTTQACKTNTDLNKTGVISAIFLFSWLRKTCWNVILPQRWIRTYLTRAISSKYKISWSKHCGIGELVLGITVAGGVFQDTSSQKSHPRVCAFTQDPFKYSWKRKHGCQTDRRLRWCQEKPLLCCSDLRTNVSTIHVESFIHCQCKYFLQQKREFETATDNALSNDVRCKLLPLAYRFYACQYSNIAGKVHGLENSFSVSLEVQVHYCWPKCICNYPAVVFAFPAAMNTKVFSASIALAKRHSIASFTLTTSRVFPKLLEKLTP